MAQRENLRSHPDFERFRSMIHRLQKPECLAAEIPDLARREDIRDRCFPTMPMVNRFNLADDSQFVGAFLIARGHFNSFPDYEDRLSHLVEVILENRVAGQNPRHAPQEDRDPAQPPVGTRLAASLPGQVRDVDAELDQKGTLAAAPQQRGLFLFQNEADIAPENPMSVLGVRPGTDISSLMKWMAGDTGQTHPYLPIVHSESIMTDVDLAALEIELRADPEAYLTSVRIRPVLELAVLPELGAWWREAAESEAVAFTQEHGQRTRAAFEKVISTFFPDLPQHMKAVRAELRLPEPLKAAIALACDLEDHFFEDIDMAAEPSLEQLVQGAISEKCRFSPGLVLRRAFACHLLTGCPMETALCTSAMELRYAQTLRLTGWEPDPDPLIDFDDRFLDDCRQPLSSYTLCENPVMEI